MFGMTAGGFLKDHPRLHQQAGEGICLEAGQSRSRAIQVSDELVESLLVFYSR